MNIASVFLVGGLLGYVWEAGIVQKERPSDTTCRYLFGRPLPFLTIYAVTAVLLVVAHHYLASCSLLTEAVGFAAIITLCELVGGYVSKKMNAGSRTWDYSKRPSRHTFGDNYCCAEATGLWLLLSLLLAAWFRG